MTSFKTYVLRVQAVSLAFFVALLSMGFTYHWQECLHAQEISICEDTEKHSSCCHTLTEAPQCLCSGTSQNACDLSFSKYIQFDFEVLTSEVNDLVSELSFNALKNTVLFSIELPHPLQHRIADYSLPPPKSGRDILCFIQTYLI